MKPLDGYDVPLWQPLVLIVTVILFIVIGTHAGLVALFAFAAGIGIERYQRNQIQGQPTQLDLDHRRMLERVRRNGQLLKDKRNGRT